MPLTIHQPRVYRKPGPVPGFYSRRGGLRPAASEHIWRPGQSPGLTRVRAAPLPCLAIGAAVECSTGELRAHQRQDVAPVEGCVSGRPVPSRWCCRSLVARAGVPLDLSREVARGYLRGYRPTIRGDDKGLAMAGKRGKQGGNTGSIMVSPARARRMRRRRRTQERQWAARSGPVTVTKLDGDGGESAPPTEDNAG